MDYSESYNNLSIAQLDDDLDPQWEALNNPPDWDDEEQDDE